jgi:hypothetical protein
MPTSAMPGTDGRTPTRPRSQAPTRPRSQAPTFSHDRSVAHLHQRKRRVHAGEFRPVLTIRAQVHEDEVAAFTRDALQELRSYIEQHHVEVSGPPFSICRRVSGDRVDVEAGWPTGGAPGSGRIHGGMLPVPSGRQFPSGPHVPTGPHLPRAAFLPPGSSRYSASRG